MTFRIQMRKCVKQFWKAKQPSKVDKMTTYTLYAKLYQSNIVQFCVCTFQFYLYNLDEKNLKLNQNHVKHP